MCFFHSLQTSAPKIFSNLHWATPRLNKYIAFDTLKLTFSTTEINKNPGSLITFHPI